MGGANKMTGPSAGHSPPGFGVYVHYVLPKQYEDDPKNRQLWEERLKPDLEHAIHILNPTSEWQGRLWLFLDKAYTDLVAHRERSFRQWAEWMFGFGWLQAAIENDPRFEKRVTLVTGFQLQEDTDEFGKDLNPTVRDTLWEFLAGGQDRLLYDAPKFIEAIIRIRNIGRGVPMFRFDDDIFFYGSPARTSGAQTNSQRSRQCAIDTRINIYRLCRLYQKHIRDVRVHNFMFSGRCIDPIDECRFRSRGFCVRTPDDMNLLINGFATRSLQLAQVDSFLEGRLEFRKAAVRSFFKRLYRFGANPFLQVMSGAGLCISDGAILDLPPFSNMHLNVMWIDDHLKFALHHELLHFSRLFEASGASREARACFHQQRYSLDRNGWPVVNAQDMTWHVREYSPRLLMGCVVDAWLRKNPLLKLRWRKSKRDEEVMRSRHKKVMTNVGNEYARHFDGLLLRDGDDQQLRKTMWKQASARLEKINEFFGKPCFQGTFIEMFLRGDWRRELSDCKPDIAPNGFGAAFHDLAKELPDNTSGSPDLAASLVRLIDDMIRYIDFVRLWPTLVQMIRHR
jgi:hypothetical protein